jgi:hypothetical protein
MNDDLKLILGCYAQRYGLTKIVVNIPHGLNDEILGDGNYKYYKEPEIKERLLRDLPLHCKDMVDEILFIERVFEIVS